MDFWLQGVNFGRILRFFYKKALKIPLQKTHKTPIAPSLRAFAECEAIHYAPFGRFLSEKFTLKIVPCKVMDCFGFFKASQ